MYIRSKASKKAHKDNCRYCQKIFEENKKQYECTDDAIDDGCVFCQYCSPIVERLNKKKAHIEEVAHKLKLKYNDEILRELDIININIRSVFLASQEAAKHMANSGGGSIINISSIGGIIPDISLKSRNLELIADTDR